jgi:hypothetical protein
LFVAAKLDGVKTYMRMRRVPNHLQVKVIKWFDYLWLTQKCSDEEKAVSCLPGKSLFEREREQASNPDGAKLLGHPRALYCVALIKDFDYLPKVLFRQTKALFFAFHFLFLLPLRIPLTDCSDSSHQQIQKGGGGLMGFLSYLQIV